MMRSAMDDLVGSITSHSVPISDHSFRVSRPRLLAHRLFSVETRKSSHSLEQWCVLTQMTGYVLRLNCSTIVSLDGNENQILGRVCKVCIIGIAI